MTFRKFLRAVSVAVMLPAVALHELTHALAAIPLGRPVAISLWPPRTVLEYRNTTPRWFVRYVNLAPAFYGVLLGAPLLFWVLFYSPYHLPLRAYLTGLWLVYTVPVSHDDRHPFEHAKQVG